jgi:outer membrane receptor protein involved in Fe transport
MRRMLGTGIGLMALATAAGMTQSALAQSTATQSTAAAAAKPQTASQAAGSDAPTTVVINAKPPVVVHKIDRTVYDLRDSPQATTGSVSDVLGTLPAVTVDTNGNVSVRGGGVQVVVDGKPSPALRGANLAQALQSMPANTVARIEVITNPGPEFRTNAPTVINIITRKTGTRAPTGDLVVNIGDEGRYNGTVSGSFGIGKWAFNGSLNLRQDRRANVADVDRITRNSDGSIATHMIESDKTRYAADATNVDLGVNYTADDNDSFSLAGNAGIRPREARSADHIIFVDPTSGAVLNDSDTTSSGPSHYNSKSLTGGYKHKGKRDGESFSLQVRHEEDDFLQDRRFFQTYAVPTQPVNAYHQVITERELTDDINGDYVLPLATDTQFKSGFDVEVTRNDSFNATHPIDALTGLDTATGGNHFLIDQTLSAGYVDYQQPLGKWVGEVGLRAENMETRIRYDRTEPFISNSDLQWSPSLFLSRQLTKNGKFKLTYSHRIDRPNDDQLYGLTQQLDAQDIYTGNPKLKPAQTESYEVGYDYTTKPVTFTGTFFMRQTRGSIVDYSYYAHPGDTVLISTVENAGNGSSGGLDLSLDMHPSPKIEISLNSTIFHTRQTAPVDGVNVRRSLSSANSKATLTLNPTAADMVQFQVMDFGKSLMADGYSQSAPFVNLSYSHKLNAKLKLVITDNDLFHSQRYQQRIQTAQYRDNTNFKMPGRVFYIGLDYKLGAVKGN